MHTYNIIRLQKKTIKPITTLTSRHVSVFGHTLSSIPDSPTITMSRKCNVI